jgi:predicted transcriptional regulator
VQKTSVYLSAEDVARLASLADREGTSQAEVVRRAIASYEPERRGDRNFSLVGVADGPGGSIADVSPDELLEGFGA